METDDSDYERGYDAGLAARKASSMNSKEAFEQAGYSNEWELWQAACAYQKQIDAGICQRFGDRDMHPHECASAILNQGDE